MSKIISSLTELQFYVNLLEDLHEKKYNNYDLLIKDLLVEFNIKVSKNEIVRLYEPTIDEEIKDLKLIYNNLN